MVTSCPFSDPRLVGDPVDTLSGAVVDRMLDFRLIGPIEMRWYRHYDSSKAHRSFSLGNGSAHEYDRRLSIDRDGFLYEEPVGIALRFPWIAADREVAAFRGMSLVRLSRTRYRLFRKGQPAMEFIFQQDSRVARLGGLLEGEQEVRFRYDPAGRMTAIVDSLKRELIAREDTGGRLTELVLNAGKEQGPRLIAYEYDERGNMVATRNAFGHGHAFAYDAGNRMVLRRGRKNFQFHFKYDSQGRCIRAMGDDRLYGVALEFATPGRVTFVTRPDLGRWRYMFNAAGQLEEIRNPLGGTRKFVREPSGRLVMEIDENENVSQYVYDDAGALVGTIDPLGAQHASAGGAGEPKRTLARIAANAAEYELGGLLDLASIVLPAAAVEVLALPAEARGVVATPASGVAPQSLGFDVRPLGPSWWPKPRRGRIFNSLGKLVAQIDDSGRTRSWSYDASGNVAGFRDFDGGQWSYDYETWHLLRAFTNPCGETLRLSYDTYGKASAFIDAGGTASEYKYDLCGRLVAVHRHGRPRDRYVRDPAGNMIAKLAADDRELLRREIGPGNRLLKRKLASGDEQSFKYDADGRIIEANSSKSSVQLAYHAFGRSADQRDGKGVVSRFDASRIPVESLVLGQYRILYRKRGQRLDITDPTDRVHNVSFASNGFVERRFANGVSEHSQYDTLGRCHFKLVKRPGKPAWMRRFHWSGEGELRHVADNMEGDVQYAYDPAHRLKAQIIGGRSEDYIFDPANNLLTQPGLSGVRLLDGNRLLEANGCRYHYNDRDHIARCDGPLRTVAYKYDSRDQLISLVAADCHWEAEYDALGRRTLKRHNGRVTKFYWNGDQLAAEIGPDKRLRVYIYADPLALSPLVFVDYDDVGAPPKTGRVFTVVLDQRGAPCLINDYRGLEVWSARIAPFGQAQVSPQSSIRFDLRLAGQYCDDETGLHYNRFRYYDPRLGRYIQSDPWGTAGGANLYAYRTNPLQAADVRGLGEETEDGFDCPEEDGESIWDKTVENAPEEGAEVPPELQAKVEESQAAYEQARLLAGDLRDEQGNPKTVVVVEDRALASGTKPTEPFDHVPTDQVMRAHGADTFSPDFRDQGVPGSYNACHGEPQASAISDAPMGVSQTICDSCHSVLQQKADRTGQPVVVTDPQGTRIYYPNSNGG